MIDDRTQTGAPGTPNTGPARPPQATPPVPPQAPPPNAAPAQTRLAGYEPCEVCGAPLDPQQRYCVNCAARRGNGANPSSRYFAAMGRRARKPLVPPKKERSPGARAAAVGFFALLPVAVGLGILIGRGDGGSSDTDALVQALKQAEAKTAGVEAGTAEPVAAANPKANKAKAKAKAKSNKAKPGKQDKEGTVVAETENGTVHKVEDFEASPEKEQQDTKIVEENPEQVGDDYIKAQQNLPDVTVIGGDPGAAPAPTNGAEP